MKTWLDWDVWIIFVLVGILLIAPGLLPSIKIAETYYGGGVVREWVFNHVIVDIVPVEHNEQLIDWWQQTGVSGEFVAYLLITLNIYACLLPATYGLCKFKIEITNWYYLKQFKIKHQSIRRK